MAEQENPRERFAKRRTSSVTSRSDESVKRVSMAGPSMARRVSGASYTLHSSTSFKNRPRCTTNDDAFFMDPRRKGLKYENTYRMEPKITFPEIKVRKIVKDALNTLENHKYDAKISSTQSKLLSQRILDEVRLLNIERYKFVCLVSIGSKARQGLRMASRCLWNTDHDTVVSETLEKNAFFAVASLYAFYFE